MLHSGLYCPNKFVLGVPNEAMVQGYNLSEAAVAKMVVTGDTAVAGVVVVAAEEEQSIHHCVYHDAHHAPSRENAHLVLLDDPRVAQSRLDDHPHECMHEVTSERGRHLAALDPMVGNTLSEVEAGMEATVRG